MKSQLNNCPLVTIAIPTYNRLELLKRCVGSVLIQDYENIEICISDNASSDETLTYLMSLHDERIKIKININSVNYGMAANWDKCFSMSEGRYFLLMSDDDALATSGAITKFVQAYEIKQSNEIGFVFSDVYIESPNGQLSKKIPEKGCVDYSLENLISDFYQNKISIFPCATFLRRDDLVSINGYKGFGANLAVDACVWIAILKKYRYARRIHSQLSIYRNHQSLSSSPVGVLKKDFLIMKKLLVSEKNRIIQEKYEFMISCINAAERRSCLGYIIRQLKYNSEYNFIKLIQDIWNNRFDLFYLSNLVFIIRQLKNKILK